MLTEASNGFKLCSMFPAFQRVLCIDFDVWLCGEPFRAAVYVPLCHVKVLNYIKKETQRKYFDQMCSGYVIISARLLCVERCEN